MFDVYVSLYLDKRRKKASGKYPVRIRVFTPTPRVQKLYQTRYDFTESEFSSIWETTKPRSQYKDIRRELRILEAKAIETARDIVPFSFQEFERHLFGDKGGRETISHWFDSTIKELKKMDRYGSAISYDTSQKSIQRFYEVVFNKSFDRLTFGEVTPSLLEQYEKYMVENGRALTTVGIYMRSLRAIFNKAIDRKIIDRDLYPFGKRKYQIPAPRNVKKALTKEQLKGLINSEPETPEQEKARDFWLFSYGCNGMNIKDILLLKRKEIKGDKIVYYRAKTKTTTKTSQLYLQAFLNENTTKIIEKYGNTRGGDEDYLFPEISKDDSPGQIHRKKQNFVRFINQHIKKLALKNGLPGEISTYWARHTYVTIALRNGASMEFIQESLGHRNIKTTQTYFEGFEDSKKREFANQLFNL